MGLDTHSEETVYRRRNTTNNNNNENDSNLSSAGRSEIKITYKTANADSNNNTNKEDEFDAEITTLNNGNCEEALATAATENLPPTELIAKLKEIGAKTPILPSQIGTDFNYKREIVWTNALGFLVLHLCALIGLVLALIGMADYRTVVYSFILLYGSGLGVTMGAHRLWSHRSFKATASLRLFLLWLHTLAGQNCLYVWVRDHRQHHKFSDTDADPHNANRGFFFSHVGWLMSKKHPKVFEYGKKIDMSDLEADKWIMFQKEHYKVLYTIFALLLPTGIPIVFWNENPIISLFVAFFARAVIQLNATWSVNSAAHLFGTRPFDKTIFPVESMFVAFFAVGEGWHNYHHAFPWDYRASELGTPVNMTGYLIDKLASWGYVYDRKSATHIMVKNRVMRTGDKSHKVYGTKDGQNSFKTLWNIWKHPSNPTYTSVHSPKPKIINEEGYALIPDELSKNELDEDFLSKETDALEKEQDQLEANGGIIKKYIVEKAEANKIIGDLSKYILSDENGADLSKAENLNNNEPISMKLIGKTATTITTTVDNSTSYSSKDKNELNVNVNSVQ